MFSAFTDYSFVLILSPTEVQQVADLQHEKEALKREKEAIESEKKAMEREAAKLKRKMEEEKAEMQDDIDTLQKWSAKLHKAVKMINRDFQNLFEDIKNKANLYLPGTKHTDNCDVSVLITVCLQSLKELLYSLSLTVCTCIQETSSKQTESKGVA